MNAKKGFSKKDLADQNAKVAELGKEESKLQAAIERGEKTLAENREKLKETQRSKAAENATLEQMIQKGIKAASRGETDQRAALIAALLMGGDGESHAPEPEAAPKPGVTPAPVPSPSSAREEIPASTSGGESGAGTSDEDDQNRAA